MKGENNMSWEDTTNRIRNEELFNGNTKLYRWRRKQTAIDSSLGYVASNIDCIWMNLKTGKWCIIEDKESGSQIANWQHTLLTNIHNACLCLKGYQGMFSIEVVGEEPEITKDTRIKINGVEMGINCLLNFFRFEPPDI